jgi:hypothetical protein
MLYDTGLKASINKEKLEVDVDCPKDGKYTISGFANYSDMNLFLMYGDFSKQGSEYVKFVNKNAKLTWTYAS